MSKIALTPNASGTGTFSIASPGTNTDRTLTLPDATGTVVYADANGNVGIGTTSPDNVPSYKGLTLSGTSGGFVFAKSTTGSITAEMSADDGTASSKFGSRTNHPVLLISNGTERARIDTSGNLLVGLTGPSSSRLTVSASNATDYTNAQAQFIANSGDVILSLHAAGASAVCIDHIRGSGNVRIVNLTRTAFAPIAASAFNVNSDYRIKENVEPMTGASARLAQIPVYRFNFVEGSMSYRDGETVDGFLAHEVQSVVPEAVTGEKDAVNEDDQPILQSIDQSKLVPLLTAALQEALTEIASMKARITALEAN
jgi:hypothetical protein